MNAFDSFYLSIIQFAGAGCNACPSALRHKFVLNVLKIRKKLCLLIVISKVRGLKHRTPQRNKNSILFLPYFTKIYLKYRNIQLTSNLIENLLQDILFQYKLTTILRSANIKSSLVQFVSEFTIPKKFWFDLIILSIKN
ncbi:hypothetical protein BpHYR1_047421 [Brachionus plicatilis]|uniref:Uncharacterized protein n=1 Tax=Brachionus plicatilis TaxID=10195 RepID=A0A3M7T1X9_BRAPC|nr:hypothetical protein BpHYR1_047421 [Brachionus plicatilis]